MRDRAAGGGASQGGCRMHVQVRDDAAEARIHSAIFAALTQDSDEAFGELLAAVCAVVAPDGSHPLVDTQHPDTGATALMVSAARGRTAVILGLLNLGAVRCLLLSNIAWHRKALVGYSPSAVSTTLSPHNLGLARALFLRYHRCANAYTTCMCSGPACGL
jgi:hypothetical protein